jgi:RNA polymerase sigma factor (sigma-70 family)
MATWRDDKILELANQLTYSPAEKRHEQLWAAVGLLPDIDAARTYPWDFVHFRITGFQPVKHIDHAVNGKLLRADLATLIEFLSDTLSIPVDDAGDAVLTMEEVGKKFEVSSKTIQRWRKQGLIALKYVYADGRRRLGFLEGAVSQFAADNKERVEKSANFKQLTEEEKKRIVEMARGLVGNQHGGMKEVCRRIGLAIGRAPETVRYTLRKHDADHPEAAIFGEKGELPRAEKAPGATQAIMQAVRSGELEHARKIKTLKIEYMPNPLFEHPDAENIILTVLPAEALARAQASVLAGTNPAAGDVYMARVPRDLPAYLQEVFRQPVMPHELETDAFRRFHYLRYKAARRQEWMNVHEATAGQVDEIESLLAQANEIKNLLVQANLRVAVHVARKHQRPDRPLAELISDATIWLMRAVEKFDFARGGRGGGGSSRFSTYASYAIMKNFARDRAEQLTRRDSHLVTGQHELLNAVGAREGETSGEHLDAAGLHSDLRSVIEELSHRERELLARHYGLEEGMPAMSLAEIGDKMGITKARVRQLEERALRKLRHLLEKKSEKLRRAGK